MVLASQNARPGRHRLPPRRSRRRRRLVIGAAVILGVGGLGWMLANPRPQPGDGAPADAGTVAQAPPAVSMPAPELRPVRTVAGQPEQSRDTERPTPKRLAAAPPIAAASLHEATAPDVRPAPASPPVAATTALLPRRDTTPAPLPPIVPGDPDAWREVRERLERNVALIDPDKPVESRRWLTDALSSLGLAPDEQSQVRAELTELNQRLVFSPTVIPGDPHSLEHAVEPGSVLSQIVPALGLQVDWRLILRVNGISDAKSIRAGQRLKLVRGPFHAVVSKPDYRLDLYLGSGADRVYVRSFPVGLGKDDGTPIGMFCVKRGSKLVNPVWTDPMTNEVYGADDPENPIGERWIGLEGIEPATRDKRGFGIHGTIEPETIGTQASMGCVRMLHEDVAVVYEALVEGVSTVEITP